MRDSLTHVCINRTHATCRVHRERLLDLINEHIGELEASPSSSDKEDVGVQLASEEGTPTSGSTRVTHISFIGYSLGGLITRYVVGKLEHQGAFRPDGGRFTPVTFLTFATPHLGAWKPPQGFRDRVFNSLVSTISSWSGHHIMFTDEHTFGRPLLINMSDPSLCFHEGLLRFKQLALLANIHHDQVVPHRLVS